MKHIKVMIALFLGICIFTDVYAQVIGEKLPSWKSGQLDIHHINTGRGNATFLLLPDGTTLLIDAGALDPTKPRTKSPRNTAAKPSLDRQPGEWIARYIRTCMLEAGLDPHLDYAQITHFHDDHMGAPASISQKSVDGHYLLTGITEVANYIPIHKIIDRGYPNYDFPNLLNDKMMQNYKSFVASQSKNNSITFEKSVAGSKEQITLKNYPERYHDSFEIRNIISNGALWTGIGNTTKNLFPELASLQPGQYPSENMCSIGIKLSYGGFDYFSGGDMPGVLRFGSPMWQDIETPVSQIVGPVEALIVDHHGNRDSQNDRLLAALRPQVLVIPVWSSDHPGHDVLDRMLSETIYPGPRAIFATDMLEANKLVIGEMLQKLKSDSGHIVIRVSEKGERFQVIILEDNNESRIIKSVHGPYYSR